LKETWKRVGGGRGGLFWLAVSHTYTAKFLNLQEAPMIFALLLALSLGGDSVVSQPPFPTVALTTHTYEARIRLNGKVSTTQVQASDAGQAKKLVQSQYPTATVLSVKKVD
jgi:hypothetical protein